MALLEESLSQPTEDTGMQSVLRTLLKKKNQEHKNKNTHTLISNFFKSIGMFCTQYLKRPHYFKKIMFLKWICNILNFNILNFQLQVVLRYNIKTLTAEASNSDNVF